MHRPRAADGFTLIELIIAMVVIGILFVVALPILSAGLQGYDRTHDALRTLDKLRYATERLAREIREVRYSGGAYTMTTTFPSTTASLSLTRSDGVVVTVTRSGASLTLGYSSPSVSALLTDGVNAFQLDYYQLDGSNATSAANVAYVQVRLALAAPSGATYEQRTRVALRNQ